MFSEILVTAVCPSCCISAKIITIGMDYAKSMNLPFEILAMGTAVVFLYGVGVGLMIGVLALAQKKQEKR